MRRALAPGIVLAALLMAAARPVAATEWWRDGDRSLEFTGSVRELATTTNGTGTDRFQREAAAAGLVCVQAARFSQCPAFDAVSKRDVWQSLTRLRLAWDLTWDHGLSAHVAYDNEWRFGVLQGQPFGPAERPETFLGLEGDVYTAGFREGSDGSSWFQRLYRGYVEWEGKRVALRLGRLRVPWGVGRLWNPIDRFNAIPPLQVEADQSPGIDAVDARWLLSGFDYFQVVYAPRTRSSDAKVALRFHGVVHDVDVSAMVGRFDEAPTFGGDLAGNLIDAAWRIEAVYTEPKRKVWQIGDPEPRAVDPFWQVVVSLDYQFDVGDGLYVLVEHLYDGNALGFGEGRAGRLLPLFAATATPPPGVPAALGPFVEPMSADRFAGSGVVSFARHQTGLELGTDLTTGLRGDLLVLWDWNGSSAAVVPSLRFTGWNAGDITIGAQLFAGGDASQYGGQPALVYALLEIFF